MPTVRQRTGASTLLKESLKFVPILGFGMMFFGFVFMSRKMEVDAAAPGVFLPAQ